MRENHLAFLPEIVFFFGTFQNMPRDLPGVKPKFHRPAEEETP
jgi:hypothetical protein